MEKIDEIAKEKKLEGKLKKKFEIAQNMKKQGLKTDIMTVTGLTKEQVENL